MEFLPLVCPAQKPASPKPITTEKYGSANSWDGDLKITMRKSWSSQTLFPTELNRHKQLPDTSVYQSGKEGGRDGAEQGPGSEAGQIQIGGAGYAVPSFGSPALEQCGESTGGSEEAAGMLWVKSTGVK